jgi:hypothetical protein
MAKPSGNPRGRPPKSALAEIKEKRSVGRPKGTQAIINDYRDRMLNSPKSAKVLEAIFDAALDPEHKNQAAAWKLIIDRVAPISAFDVKAGSSGVPTISINISGLNDPKVESVQEYTDVEVKDYYDDES